MNKLTPAQQRVYDKLIDDQWWFPEKLCEKSGILMRLEAKGYVESSSFSRLCEGKWSHGHKAYHKLPTTLLKLDTQTTQEVKDAHRPPSPG